MIFDTHAHYDDAAFDEDRDRILTMLPKNGVSAVVNVTSTLSSLDLSLKIADSYSHVYSSMGLHPTEIYELGTDALNEVEGRCTSDKVVAIGEIGLDYHYPDTDKERQKEFFEAQLELARKYKLPVIVHSRDAAADTLDIMKAHHAGDIGGVIHCFSYSYEMACEYVKMGFFIGIGGVLTYKNARKLVECAEKLPLENIVLETDCPYLAPVPNRGRRNYSLYLTYVADQLAALRGIPRKEAEDITFANALRLYGLREDSFLTGSDNGGNI